ncbi:MAG TPA: YcxB family protein [Spirochaetota bacterium]|nr:YcxB family protein [Spirochaetota bacterium]HPJ41741.1 YcxB family protein [Spirochaetota bacterium]HPR36652.1 YcxB family protein [Spirochaetota bacterium]
MKDFIITFNDYMNAQHLFLGWKRWIIQLAILPVILFIFFNREINYFSSILISFILLLLAVFLVPSLNRKRLLKIYRSQQNLRINTKVNFNDEYVEWITDSGSDRIRWNDIYQYKTSNNIIIILSSKKIMHPVPVSAFESKDELNRFLNLLTKKR